MNLEDTLVRTFESRLDAVEVSSGDVEGARSAGRRMLVRRRVASGVAAAVVVAAGVAGMVVSGAPHADVPSGGVGHWRELPTPPLSPRADALSVWTGTEVLVLGGDPRPCPPNADSCAVRGALRDGAAYDPTTDTWHRIAPAPDGLLSVVGAVVVDGRLVVGGSRWSTYDPIADRWTTIPTADGTSDPMAALGGSVYALRRGRVVVYDDAAGSWSTVPADPNRPALTQKTLTATSAGPVLTGYTFDTHHPVDMSTPPLALADVWDGTAWKRLPPSHRLGISFSWTGERMVDPNPYVEKAGGAHGWAQDVPTGGTLDPTTGTWGRLPAALTSVEPGWRDVSASGGPWFAFGGRVYDDSTGRVETLPRPDGAPDVFSTAAWADGRLVVFGGADATPGATADALTNRAWIFTP
jgi:hypothetical protein